jgi:single-strand DNA-binding protein
MTEPMIQTRKPTPTPPESESCNEVMLVGRVSATPETRELPSGDQLVTLRVVVDRPPQKAQRAARKGVAKRAVDVIDVACWSKRTQRTAGTLEADDGVRVEGALRRRFFAAGGGRASRYEVEASRLVRVSRSAGPQKGPQKGPPSG